MKLFGVNVSGLIHKYVSPGVLPAVLRKVTPGTRTAGAQTAGTNPTTTDYACRGFIDKKPTQSLMSTQPLLSPDDMASIVLIGDSIEDGQVPRLQDIIIIEDTQYRVVGPTDRDPAAATFTCFCNRI